MNTLLPRVYFIRVCIKPWKGAIIERALLILTRLTRIRFNKDKVRRLMRVIAAFRPNSWPVFTRLSAGCIFNVNGGDIKLEKNLALPSRSGVSITRTIF